MDVRQATWGVALRLAVVLSAIAAVVALALDSLGIPEPTIVLTVIVAGFVTSWVRTGQVARSFRASRAHRAITVPVRNVHHRVA